MKKLGFLAIFIGVIAIPFAAQAQPNPGAQNWDDFVVASAEHVAGNIYKVVGGVIVNMAFSVGDDGIMLVDSNFEDLTDQIIAAIGQVSDKPIRFLIDTHSHTDHAEGNVSFGETGTIIVAHDAVRGQLANPPRGEAAAAVALPIITFPEQVNFHFNGEEVEAFHIAAGHTDGDIMIHFKGSDVIHMGDVFVGHYPIVDTSRDGHLLGIVESLNAAIERVGANTKIIPGHGDVANREDMIEFRDMLVGIYDKVSSLVAEGKSLQQVIAAGPTSIYDDRWAGPQGSRGIVTAAYNAALSD